MIDNEHWNVQSYAVYKEWERAQNENAESAAVERVHRNDRPGMYRLITAWCNATEYEEWSLRTFGIEESSLPMMVMYSPKEDGYWKMEGAEGGMLQFVEDVFDDKLEITYARSWFARQAGRLERWLNSLNAWQIALVFIAVFVGLCGLMVLLDWMCSPKMDEGIKMD